MNKMYHTVAVMLLAFIVGFLGYAMSTAMASAGVMRLPFQSGIVAPFDCELSPTVPFQSDCQDMERPVLTLASSDRSWWEVIKGGIGWGLGTSAVTGTISAIWYWGGAEALCFSGLFPPACGCVGPQC